MKKLYYGLFSVVALKLGLSIYGIAWGLPYRWNLDERITTPLRMIAERTFFYCSVDFYHPLFYKYFLMVILAPYYLFLKLMRYDLSIVKTASSVSWLSLVKAAPDFANGLMLIGRLSSVMLGLGTVLMVYMIAKKIYGKGAGLLSALAFALNIGVIATHHYIKNENLSLFLFVCVLYLWIYILTSGFSAWRIYLAALLTGLAIGTKLDAAILMPGLIFMALSLLKDTTVILRRRFTILGFTAVFVCVGILFGYPRIIIPVHVKMGIVEGAVAGFSVLFSLPTLTGTYMQIKMVLLNIISSFGIPLAVFVAAGMGLSLSDIRRGKKPELLLYSILIPYLVVLFFLYTAVATKLVIFLFPMLAIFAGRAFDRLWNALSSRTALRYSIAVIVVLYSLFYAVKADMVFAKNDTRYLATDWIKNNIRPGSTIGIFQEPEVLFSSSLVNNYKIYYQGEELRYDNNPYRDMSGKEANPEDGAHWKGGYDYVVVSSWDYMKYERGLAMDRVSEKLAEGKDYYLAKRIEYPEDIFLNPRPAQTSPVIFIFKRHTEDKGRLTNG